MFIKVFSSENPWSMPTVYTSAWITTQSILIGKEYTSVVDFLE
jgi:hypothetical protein